MIHFDQNILGCTIILLVPSSLKSLKKVTLLLKWEVVIKKNGIENPIEMQQIFTF